MWRFILISFGFLGFAFYQASGGADYAPAPDSLQVAMRNTSLFAAPLKPAPVEEESSQMAEAEMPTIQTPKLKRIKTHSSGIELKSVAERGEKHFVGLSGNGSDELGGLEITLASAATNLSGGDAIAQRPVETVGMFSAETLVRDVNRTPIEQALVVPQQQPADIRSIAGSNANMRSGPGTDYAALDQLSQGTQVEVLDRRGAWVELRNMQTGQTGWMADWLITSTN